jgi:branched-chain amino acid transport system ATP-binding protein
VNDETSELFQVRGLSKTFGGLTAISGVDMTIGRGEIRALIGPNGAGKTTFLNLITGVFRPTSGEIHFNGHSLVGMRPSKIVAQGVVRTFQHPALFEGLNVLDNVCVAATARKPWNVLGEVACSRQARVMLEDARDSAHKWLSFVRLQARAYQPVTSLTPAERRLAEVARALAAEPKLLLLDEPFAGMTQSEALSLCDLIKQVQASGVSVILIDHNMSVVMKMADQVTVLSFGRLIADGTPAAVRQSEEVISAYLGKDHVAAPA